MSAIKRKRDIKSKPPIRQVDRIEANLLIENLLDQEPLLQDLRCMIIAMNLTLSGSYGLDADDMPGARFVARAARDAMEEVHQAWRDLLDHAKAGSTG